MARVELLPPAANPIARTSRPDGNYVSLRSPLTPSHGGRVSWPPCDDDCITDVVSIVATGEISGEGGDIEVQSTNGEQKTIAPTGGCDVNRACFDVQNMGWPTIPNPNRYLPIGTALNIYTESGTLVGAATITELLEHQQTVEFDGTRFYRIRVNVAAV